MIHKELVEHKKSFLKEWKDKEIDVLVTPVMPFTALYPGSTELLIYQLTYCCFQNVLELPAGVIPTRFVLPNET
jgi:Asp-tRNA(Asn)/Glu-tRNA(Gln) amidotransferase A subunit family amidase